MSCKMCGDCCRRIKLEIHDDDHATWASYHGLKLETEGSKRWAVIPIACHKLVDGKCSIHDSRPYMCERYFCQEAKNENS